MKSSVKKRAISLLLALSCTLALPALAAEEPCFRDEQDIVHLEAAKAVVRLGVMWGKEDGTFFAPKDEVTRGEAAKYIALLLRGGEDIVVSANAPKAEPAFPDIDGHWAEAYINYCAEKGAAFAQEDGNFDPNGLASAFELLRMAEAALGEEPNQYAAAENWIALTHALALQYGLFTGLDDFTGKAVADHALIRDEAAQLLYNALNATPKAVGASGFYEDAKRPDGTPSTLLRENFGYDSWDGVPPLPDKAKPEEKKPKAPAVDPTEFSDAKDVQYWPAVASLTKLGVVSGKDGGVFDPAGNVTRAEAAKLIAVIMNGGSEANIGARSEPTFTDIQGHWAEGYIEYCADMKIVSGWDGRFDPDGEVSVIQFYKMALTALGYDWVVYRLAGPGWAEQALECARKTNGRNLTEGLPNDGLDGAGADQPASREMVAQILYNALQATTIEMAPDKNTSGGEIVWSHQSSSLTLLQVRFGRDELPTVPPQPTV